MNKIKMLGVGLICYAFAFVILNLLPLPFFTFVENSDFAQFSTHHCSLNYFSCYSDYGGTISNFPEILGYPVFSNFILPILLPLVFSVVMLRFFYKKKQKLF
jgi:hypothetical protein